MHSAQACSTRRHSSMTNISCRIEPSTKKMWNGIWVPVAADQSSVSANQFGEGWKVPYRNRLQCVENMFVHAQISEPATLVLAIAVCAFGGAFATMRILQRKQAQMSALTRFRQ